MFQLLISSLPAVIKTGTTFKLTRENPAFSEQGDYTFEVTLPLQGCKENLLIYGPIHHPEANLKPALTDKPFRLISPLITLSGTARVTSVSEKEVKVQLVAGRSEANLSAKDADGNDIYIDSDQLQLGTVFDEVDIPTLIANSSFTYSRDWTGGPSQAESDQKPYTGKNISTPQDLATFFLNTANDFSKEYGTFERTTCVFFPIRSTSSETTIYVNRYHWPTEADDYNVSTYDGRTAGQGRSCYRLHPENLHAMANSPLYDFLAPQPRIVECLRRILRGIGYELDTAGMSKFMRSVIIANSRISIKYKDFLPNWTITDFIKEFNNFFSTVIIFNENKKATVRQRKAFYEGASVTINEISEELETDFEEESAEGNSATGNVDYEWPETDDMLRLPDEVWGNVEAQHFASLTAIETHFSSLTAAQKQASDHLMVNDADGSVYAILQNNSTNAWELTRVDQYPPLIRDTSTRDISTTLKIVPCRMELVEAGTATSGGTTTGIPQLVTSDGYEKGKNAYNVNTAINTESQSATDEENSTSDKRDVIEVAIADQMITAQACIQGTSSKQLIDTDVPAGVLTVRDTASNLPIDAAVSNSSTVGKWPSQGPFTLSGDGTFMQLTSFNEGELITSRIEHQFKFIARQPIDITSTFIIRSRPYVCHKLEYTIQPDRVNPLVTGYFYELNSGNRE